MTIESGAVRSGSRAIAPRVALVLAAALGSFGTAACMRDANASESAVQAVADDSANASAVLAAVRGESPLACSFTSRALENRWGTRRQLGGPDVATLDNAQAEAFDWAMSGQSTESVMPVLRRAMSDPDACVRRTAAQLVGRIRAGNVADELRSELGSSDAMRRETAVLALGYAEDTSAVPALTRVASDPEPRVRRTAAWALGRSKRSDAATTALLRMIHDADAMVRVNAELSLGALSAGSAVEPLTERLASDPDARVRRAAAAALGQIDNTRSKP